MHLLHNTSVAHHISYTSYLSHNESSPPTEISSAGAPKVVGYVTSELHWDRNATLPEEKGAERMQADLSKKD